MTSLTNNKVEEVVAGKRWCEVGEHWEDDTEFYDDFFADCRYCCHPKEYREVADVEEVAETKSAEVAEVEEEVAEETKQSTTLSRCASRPQTRLGNVFVCT